MWINLLSNKEVNDWCHLMFTKNITHEWIKNSSIPTTINRYEDGNGLILALAEVIKDQNLAMVHKDFDHYEEIMHVPDTTWVNIATSQMQRVKAIEADYNLHAKIKTWDHYKYSVWNQQVRLDDYWYNRWGRTGDLEVDLTENDFLLVDKTENRIYKKMHQAPVKFRDLYKSWSDEPLAYSSNYQNFIEGLSRWQGSKVMSRYWRKKLRRIISVEEDLHWHEIWYMFWAEDFFATILAPQTFEMWWSYRGLNEDGSAKSKTDIILEGYSRYFYLGDDSWTYGTEKFQKVNENRYMNEVDSLGTLPEFTDLHSFGYIMQPGDRLKKAVIDFYNPMLYNDCQTDAYEIKLSAYEKLQNDKPYLLPIYKDKDGNKKLNNDEAIELRKDVENIVTKIKDLKKELADLEFQEKIESKEALLNSVPLFFDELYMVSFNKISKYVLSLDYKVFMTDFTESISEGAILAFIKNFFLLLHEIWLWFVYFIPFTVTTFVYPGQIVFACCVLWSYTWYKFDFETIYTNPLDKDTFGGGDLPTTEYINPENWNKFYEVKPNYSEHVKFICKQYDKLHNKVIDCNGYEAGYACLFMAFWCKVNFYHRKYWNPLFISREEHKANLADLKLGKFIKNNEHTKILYEFEQFYFDNFAKAVSDYVDNIEYPCEYGTPYGKAYIEKEYKHYFYTEYLRAKHLIPFERMHPLFMFFPQSEIQRFPFVRVREYYFKFGRSQCWPKEKTTHMNKEYLQGIYDMQALLYGPRIAYLNLLFSGEFLDIKNDSGQSGRPASSLRFENYDEPTYAKLALYKTSWFGDYNHLIPEAKKMAMELQKRHKLKNNNLGVGTGAHNWFEATGPLERIWIIHHYYPKMVNAWFVTVPQLFNEKARLAFNRSTVNFEDTHEDWPFARYNPKTNGSFYKWVSGMQKNPGVSGTGVFFRQSILRHHLGGLTSDVAFDSDQLVSNFCPPFQSTAEGEAFVANKFMDLDWTRENDGWREGFIYTFSENLEDLIWNSPTSFMSSNFMTKPNNFNSLILGSLYRPTDSVSLEGIENFEALPLEYKDLMFCRGYTDKVSALARLDILGPEKVYKKGFMQHQYKYNGEHSTYKDKDSFMPATPLMPSENAYVYKKGAEESTLILYDAAVPYQILFQNPASPMMEGIIALHHDVFVFLIVIAVSVTYLLYRILSVFGNNKEVQKPISHHTELEIFWTIVPCLILMLIAIPSFSLLYAMDEIINPALTFKAIGHQWYWSYEFSDQAFSYDEVFSFDSYMLPLEDLTVGSYRLLEVDERVALPLNVHIRLLVTSTDVLHCWTIPSLGVKLDACPGRLNQAGMYINRPGVFYGQCSEICGINHGFMPIVVQGVPLSDFDFWVTVKTFENDDVDASFSELMSRSFTS